MKTPLEKIKEHAAECAVMFIQADHDFDRENFDLQSPIEAILLTALNAVNKHGGRARFYPFNCRYRVRSGPEACLPEEKALVIEPQAKVLEYRADFLIHVPIGEDQYARLVVECDGHNFHERTARQAAHDRARDRAMQEAGYTVFRFTGREIYLDPIKCAEQVLGWAADRAVLK